MTHTEQRVWLIRKLLEESPRYRDMEIPMDQTGQDRLLRSLFNIRPPRPADDEFLKIQDAYLRDLVAQKGITSIDSLSPIQPDQYLWRGDITTLQVDAIVNAANSQMLGCFVPCHGCIDNAIHTYAGVQLRLACAQLMEKQGHLEPTGTAQITPAFNLPCRYVLHTVGPIITNTLTKNDCKMLASCYRSCLELATDHNLTSIAFCCISTGEFHFPNDKAAEIAIDTVTAYQTETASEIKVVFNVFKETDYDIYRKLLAGNR